MYDAIIVGARCGGSPTAMNLARRQHRVLVVDRATFPRDTLSTHALTGDAADRLKAWGLLDRVVAADGRGVTDHAAYHCAGREFRIPGLFLAPRRTVLDKILVDAARASGAEVREGCSVIGLLRDPSGRVTGVTLQRDGSLSTEEARVVVGADGRNSFVAREVGAEVYNEKPPMACAYYSYFENFPISTVEVHYAPGTACICLPTSNGQACLAVMRHRDQFQVFRADIDGGFQRAFEQVGLADRYASARRAEEWRGAADLPNYYRKPFGPGWTLVGDAGFLKDPVLGQGVNDAFRDADLLSSALDSVFRGEQDFDTALSNYQQERDRVSGSTYALTHELSKLQVTPEHLESLQAAAEARIKRVQAAAASARKEPAEA